MTISASALDLIRIASKLSGVLATGQQMQAEDASDALFLLNAMIASWNQNRWLVYHLVDVTCPSTGAQFYSVGIGGDFNVTRPDRIQSAYVRLVSGSSQGGTQGLSGPVDYSLGPIETYEEYGRLTLKSLQSFPASYFYDPTMPLGRFYVWPIPNTNFDLHIVVKETLPELVSLQQVMALPQEYYEGVIYNLAARIQILYQVPINPAIVKLAQAGLNTIKVANHRVGSLSMPPGLSTRSGAGAWPLHGVGGLTQGTFTLDEDVLG